MTVGAGKRPLDDNTSTIDLATTDSDGDVGVVRLGVTNIESSTVVRVDLAAIDVQDSLVCFVVRRLQPEAIAACDDATADVDRVDVRRAVAEHTNRISRSVHLFHTAAFDVENGGIRSTVRLVVDGIASIAAAIIHDLSALNGQRAIVGDRIAGIARNITAIRVSNVGSD